MIVGRAGMLPCGWKLGVVYRWGTLTDTIFVMGSDIHAACPGPANDSGTAVGSKAGWGTAFPG